MKLQAVIFDLDGTIADTLPLCIKAFKKSIEPLLGETLSDEDIISTFGPSEEGTIRKLVPDQEEQGVKDYLLHYQQLHHTCPDVFPGIKELLAMLDAKGIKLAMVTGKGSHSTKISLKQFGVERYFDVLETGSPEGPNKVYGIQHVLDKLGVDKANALYVGDAPSDIKYCKEIGIPIAAAAWAPTTNADELVPLKPDYLFYTINDFSKKLVQIIDNDHTV